MPSKLDDLQKIVETLNINSYYAQCKRCFMTGKACIYQREISQQVKSIFSSKNRLGLAFMLMPFRSTLDEIYRAQLEPCLLSVVDEVRRADDVARTGYVICEKICKQIQLAQIICAEFSCNNPNVFYELGMAYALDRNISLFIQKNSDHSRSDIKRKLSLTNEHYNLYDPFEMLDAKTINLWNTSKYSAPSTPANDSVVILLADTTTFPEIVNGQEFLYTIDGLCRGAISRTLDKLYKRKMIPWSLENRSTIIINEKGYLLDLKEKTFIDVEQLLRNAASVIISTHESEPISFFWLGFTHGLEKDVIPITVNYPKAFKILKQNKNELLKDFDQDYEEPRTLPFDMRALYHISFQYNKPIDLESQLTNILEIVSTRNKDKINRTKFWQPILEEGNVSIFVGSVELTKNKRHVVGEWDYRTVSELTSFFSSIKETMEIAIQTPTFQASSKLMEENGEINENKRKEYVNELYDKLKNGNNIILASADVNDLTEVALAIHAGIEPFISKLFENHTFNGIVGFKSKEQVAISTPSVYFQQVSDDKSKGERGFFDIMGGTIRKERTHKTTYVSYSEKTEQGYTVYHSHIAKLKLPLTNHWTVILQGITGPATLGIAQAFTGALSEQFTIFNPLILDTIRRDLLNKVAIQSKTLQSALGKQNGTYNSSILKDHSEYMASELTSDKFDQNDAVEGIVKVYVMDGKDEYHDDRTIIWWDFEFPPRKMVKPGT